MSDVFRYCIYWACKLLLFDIQVSNGVMILITLGALQWISGGWPAGCLHMSVDCQHCCIPPPPLFSPCHIISLLPPVFAYSAASYPASVHIWSQGYGWGVRPSGNYFFFKFSDIFCESGSPCETGELGEQSETGGSRKDGQNKWPSEPSKPNEPTGLKPVNLEWTFAEPSNPSETKDPDSNIKLDLGTDPCLMWSIVVRCCYDNGVKGRCRCEMLRQGRVWVRVWKQWKPNGNNGNNGRMPVGEN